ncbi:MAG: hypothetical protein RLZZ140_1095 [Pseudomonadota bacterium]
MANAVDDTGGQHRYPGHLNRPDRGTNHAEHEDLDHQQNRHAQCTVFCIEVALNPVVRGSVAVALNELRIFRGNAIKLRAAPQYCLNAACLRAMGVFLGFALGMVLTVNRRPLLGDHTG